LFQPVLALSGLYLVLSRDEESDPVAELKPRQPTAGRQLRTTRRVLLAAYRQPDNADRTLPERRASLLSPKSKFIQELHHMHS